MFVFTTVFVIKQSLSRVCVPIATTLDYFLIIYSRTPWGVISHFFNSRNSPGLSLAGNCLLNTSHVVHCVTSGHVDGSDWGRRLTSDHSENFFKPAQRFKSHLFDGITSNLIVVYLTGWLDIFSHDITKQRMFNLNFNNLVYWWKMFNILRATDAHFQSINLWTDIRGGERTIKRIALIV